MTSEARHRVEEELLATTEALEIERKHLAEAQALAMIGSWYVDVPTGAVTWSDQTYRILGMPAEERQASLAAFYDRIHPDDRDAVKEAFASAVATGSPYSFDHRLLLADGSVKWVQERSEISFGATGVVVSVGGTIQDVTDRRIADAILQQNQQLLRIASRVGRIGGWDINLVSMKVFWSDEVCAIHGVAAGHHPTLDEAIDFYAPAFRETIRMSVAECIRTGTPFDVEAQVVTAAGESVWVRAIGEGMIDTTGRVIGVSGALQNIAERMNAMNALRHSDERFRLVAEAASDVAWDWNLVDDSCWWSEGLGSKFGHAVERAAEPDFWSGRIHPDDCERVLSGVREAVASGRVWSDEYRFRKADGAYALVSDRAVILFDDAGGAHRMLGAMVDVTQQRTLEARLDQAQRLSSLGEAAANMAHEFNNVLMGIQPFVEVIRRTTGENQTAQEAAKHITISVKRGKDITDEILQSARSVEPVSRPGDLRQWLLEFATQAGALSQPSEDAPTPRMVAGAPAPGARRRTKNVLIVDDEPAVSEGIAMLLASEGLHTASILEGGATVAAIERHLPDLVLLDIGLPDISGVDVFRDIQSRWPDLPVIFMTGHYSRADLGTILDLPHVGFLQKPFGVEELLMALE